MKSLSIGDTEEIENSHTDRDPVRYLFEDDGMFAIGEVSRNFNVTIDGAGVHDRDRFLRSGDFFLGHTEVPMVLAQRRKESAFLSLRLDPKHVQRINIRNNIIQFVMDANSQFLNPVGDQRGRPANGDDRAHCPEAEDVRPCDPAVGNIADDAHP